MNIVLFEDSLENVVGMYEQTLYKQGDIHWALFPPSMAKFSTLLLASIQRLCWHSMGSMGTRTPGMRTKESKP